MKKTISMLVAVAMLFSIAGTVVAEPDIYSYGYFGHDFEMTDEMLAEMIENGDIPATVNRLLILNGNITNLAPLTALTDLKVFAMLTDADELDITHLSELENLTHLAISGGYEIAGNDGRLNVDLSPLSSLKKLQFLVLGFVPIDIDTLMAIGELTNLDGLFLSRNEITDVSPLSGLTNLTMLDLTDNNISELAPLSGLVNLKNLYLNDNNISELAPLSGLVNLKNLYLNDNNISDLAPLSGLANLETLGARNNNISDIAPLRGLMKLEDLYLDDNNIGVLTPLDRVFLNRLYTVRMRNNPIIIPGYVLSNPEVTIFDALEILKYIAGIDNLIDACDTARKAALITEESRVTGEPTIFDVLEILKCIVGMDNAIDG
ncbi:MAG: leucine-rich repeat domain-containing protein [Oscillospiraceae bacterium]|nr:leucine-rich repeat domain-containing protein [Oscillospiraceae bacterium]